MCITSGPSLAPVLPLSEVRSAMRSASLWHAFASVIVCFKEPINVRLESLRDVGWEFLVSFHSAWVLKLRRYRGGYPSRLTLVRLFLFVVRPEQSSY